MGVHNLVMRGAMRARRWLLLGVLTLLVASCGRREGSFDQAVPRNLIVGTWRRECPATVFEFTKDGKTIVTLEELRQPDSDTTTSLLEPIKAAGTYRFVGRNTLYIELEEDFRFVQAKGNWEITRLNQQELIFSPPSGQPLTCTRIAP
jgi:uncharacterized protein (TIGR03066 family)